MRFHFLLTNHYSFGLYKIEDHVRLISAGLAELGHDITYGFDDDVAPWPAMNLLVEFFNDSPVVDQVIALKRSATRYSFGMICTEDLQDSLVMDHPNFPTRRSSLEALLPHMDVVWAVVPSDYSALEGGERVRFLQYGYAAALRRPDLLQRDIDVLFYSELGPRRMPLFNDLRLRGVNSSASFGMLPGYMKHDLLDRARVIVDVLRPDSVRFMAPARVCTALHTGALVVSEEFDKGPLASLYQYTLRAAFDQIVDVCATAARDPNCLRIGSLARERFAKETSMAANLRRVMDLPVFSEAAAA
jgi:hypothetical protein